MRHRGEQSGDDIADLIEKQSNPTIATYAKTGEVHLRITARAKDEEAARKLMKPVLKELKARFGAYIFSMDKYTTLEETVVQLLRENELTLTTVESCTGGLLTGRLINVAGASEVVKQGLVTYSNKAKRKLVGVKKTTLKEYGAVSDKTAREMVKGAILMTGSDVAVAVTGIAGPDGGTKEKPVGTCLYCGSCARAALCEGISFHRRSRKDKRKFCCGCSDASSGRNSRYGETVIAAVRTEKIRQDKTR